MPASKSGHSTPVAETVPISVVTVNYNHGVYLPAYIESLLRSTHPIAEILVVDNASTDESVAILSRYPSVRVHRNAQNIGYSAALNQAFALATSPLVCATGPDVVVEPDWLEPLIAEYRRDPALTFGVASRIITSDRTQIQAAGGSLHFTGHLVMHDMWRLRDPGTPTGEPRDTGAMDSTSMLVDRKKFMAIGGCDPDFFVYHEEYDYGQRARMRGWISRFAPASVVYHGTGTAEYSVRGHGGYPRLRPFLHTRNRLLSILKNHQCRTLVAMGPVLVLAEALNLALLARMGLAGAYRDAWRWIWSNRHSIARKRRAIQRRRCVQDGAVLSADPLTFSPAVLSTPFLRGGKRILDAIFGVYWAAARRLIYPRDGLTRLGRARR